MTISTTWVLAEVFDGRPLSGTLELLTKARGLGGSVAAFCAGPGAADAADELGRYGATRVYAPELGDDRLLGAPVAAAMASRIDSGDRPDLIMFAMTYDARDIVGRLSARLDRPVLTNSVDIAVEGDRVVADTVVFGGNTLVRTAFTAEGPFLVGFRPKSFAAEPVADTAGADSVPEVVALDVGDLGPAGDSRVVERHAEERTGPKLDEAAVVVSGGRGLGSAESYQMVEELARLLHGAPGASRAIVDAGWVPYSYQVGQTGKVVKPDLYLACGISGATQHMVGMKGAKHIVAVNKDKDAPILSIADLGIVGDVHKVLPKLIEALKART